MDKELISQLGELKKLTRANLEWSRKLEKEQRALDGQKSYVNSQLAIINKVDRHVPDFRDFHAERVPREGAHANILKLRAKDLTDVLKYRKELTELIDNNIKQAEDIKKERREIGLKNTQIRVALKQAYLEAKEIKKKAQGQASKIQDEKAYYIETSDKIKKEHKQKLSQLNKNIKIYKDKNSTVKSLFRKYTELTKQVKEKDHLLGITKSFLSSEGKELKARRANLDMRITGAQALVKKLEKDGEVLKDKKERLDDVASGLLKDKHRIETGLAHIIQSKIDIEKEKEEISKDKEEARVSKLTAKEMSNENKAELDKIAKERNKLRIDIRRLDKRLKESRKNAK